MKGKRTAIGWSHLPKRIAVLAFIVFFFVIVTEEARRTSEEIAMEEILDKMDGPIPPG